MAWMAWTWQTAAFFGTVAAVLAVMTVLAVLRPETPRVGILRFPTTRGDRLFVSLIGTAFIFIAWMRLTGSDEYGYPAAIAAVFAVAMFRFA
jgi:predicted small integral membrane protein